MATVCFGVVQGPFRVQPRLLEGIPGAAPAQTITPREQNARSGDERHEDVSGRAFSLKL